jgi:hypothetical protein
MQRALLPPWKLVRVSLGVEQTEPFETFGWIKDDSLRSDLELAKKAFDMNEGSREFLKKYKSPLDGMGFSEPILRKVLCQFGGHHSGASSSSLMWLYKNILNNWDEWVLNVKNAQAKKESNYSKRQLNDADIDDFVDAFYHMERLRNGRKDSNPDRTLNDYEESLDKIRAKFKIKMGNEELEKNLMDIHYEILEERNQELKQEQELHSQDLINTMKFLYGVPIRWFTSPYGPSLIDVRKITSKEVSAMEEIYPDYREYYEKVKAVYMGTMAMTPLFDDPKITEEQIVQMSKVYPDYRQHIQKVSELRNNHIIM